MYDNACYLKYKEIYSFFITIDDYNIKEDMMLELKHISKKFHDRAVLDDLSITFPDTDNGNG